MGSTAGVHISGVMLAASNDTVRVWAQTKNAPSSGTMYYGELYNVFCKTKTCFSKEAQYHNVLKCNVLKYVYMNMCLCLTVAIMIAADGWGNEPAGGSATILVQQGHVKVT